MLLRYQLYAYHIQDSGLSTLLCHATHATVHWSQSASAGNLGCDMVLALVADVAIRTTRFI